MVISIPDATAPSFQPFQCHICQSRFTRQENLKRHAALHLRSADKNSFPCDYCDVTFSRRDLRHRHVKRKHPEQEDTHVRKRSRNDTNDGQVWDNGYRLPSTSPTTIRQQPDQGRMEIDGRGWQKSSEQHQEVHDQYRYRPEQMNSSISLPTSADEEGARIIASWLTQQPQTSESTGIDNIPQDSTFSRQPMSLESSGLGSEFIDQMRSTNNPRPTCSVATSDTASSSQHIPDGLSSKDLPYLQDEWFPSPTQTARGYQLYFAHVSPFVPFLHRPTFDATETAPHLGLAMLCLAYQHGEDPDCGNRIGSGSRLSLRCFHRARVLAASEEERADNLTNNITLVQTYWLLQICAIMYLCGRDSIFGVKMHSNMISIARFGGLTQPMPVEPSNTEDLESMWLEFVKAESHKRTLFAVHQIDALRYQLFSIPRSLSHLEIKHDLPCGEESWTALSSSQWAHRQLTTRDTAPQLRYADAVRRILSPDLATESLPTFDPYGAINIAQFLLSSVREVSGWSTMTGRLSMERFEPLRSSLVSLDKNVRQRAKKSSHTTSYEATWEMAMIELQIWSPSHTCGIVEGSVDAVLKQSTYLASSCKNVFEANTAKAIQPHIDWFLRYLDTTQTPESEPPWIILYAYKAFLIAWQLVRESFPGSMQVVRVQNGDLEGATEWARIVFQRTQRWKLGELIISCLDTLGE